MRCLAFCGFARALPFGPDENVLGVPGQRPHGVEERYHLVAERELVRFLVLGDWNPPQAFFEVDVRPARRGALAASNRRVEEQLEIDRHHGALFFNR